MTTYNRREWTQAAIESVLAQTHRPLHLVLVDDASTDGTAALIQSYGDRYPELITTIVKPRNRGYADSVLVGLRADPDTPYVIVLNDDDLWHPTLLERELALFEQCPELGLVHCDAEVSDEQLRPTGERFSDVFGRFTTGDLADVLRGNHADSSTLLFTREIARRVVDTMPDPSRVSDYYIVMLAAGYHSIAMVDEPLAVYRDTGDGMHSQTERMWRDTTLARLTLFARNPELVARIGGRRRARRELALRTLDVAIAMLRRRSWREYAWQSSVVIRMRQLRPIVWLAIHTITALRGSIEDGHRRHRDPPVSRP